MYSNSDKSNVLLTLKNRNKPTHRSVISSLYFVSHLIVFNTPIQDAVNHVNVNMSINVLSW